jgi:hypothetical protein
VLAASIAAEVEIESLRCATGETVDTAAPNMFDPNQSFNTTVLCPESGTRNKDTDCGLLLLSNVNASEQQSIELNASVHWSTHYQSAYFTCLFHSASYGECFPDCLVLLPTRVQLKVDKLSSGKSVGIDHRGCCCSTSNCNQPGRIVVLYENEAGTQAIIANYATLYNRSKLKSCRKFQTVTCKAKRRLNSASVQPRCTCFNLLLQKWKLELCVKQFRLSHPLHSLIHLVHFGILLLASKTQENLKLKLGSTFCLELSVA